MQFPKHEASLHLTHNQHKAYYESVEQAIGADMRDNSMATYPLNDWISEEQRQKAVATDEVWELQWYPNTPIGFNRLIACDLDVLLAYALEY